MTAFWIALAVLLAGIIGGLAYAILRGIALWRQVKRTGGAFTVETSRIAVVADGIQTHLDRAGASSERLRASAGRLSVSRARLDVQLQAVREARLTFRRLFWYLGA